MTRCTRLALFPLAVLCFVASSATADQPTAQPPKPSALPGTGRPPTVLFMCPHGAAKSVLASAYFQRLAKERGLNVRVESGGTEPDPAVSSAVAAHLAKNGYQVPIDTPRRVSAEEFQAADVVISLGCDLTGLPARRGVLQRWDEVPGPGENFAAADEAIRKRVAALIEDLVKKPARH
jgi:arsenate reductase (thioredoxin)